MSDLELIFAGATGGSAAAAAARVRPGAVLEAELQGRPQCTMVSSGVTVGTRDIVIRN